MKKFLFPSFMFVFGLVMTNDVYAVRNMRARGVTTKTSTSTTTSSSSSSDISSFTRRFVSEAEKYSDMLFYGKKYPLSDFLFYGVASYYKTNGSEGLNEKLCFGPFMTLTGVSNGGDIVTFTSEGEISCQPLLADYTYSLELKEATAEKLQNLPERMLKVTRQDVNLSYMPLDAEPYVDVEDFVVKIGKAIKDAKNSCGAFYSNVEEIKKNLSWNIGTSAIGTALSGTATGLGVQNVKKTDQIIKNNNRIEQLNNVKTENGTIDELREKMDSDKAAMDSAEKVVSSISYDEIAKNKKIKDDYEKVESINDFGKCDDSCKGIYAEYDYDVSSAKNFDEAKESFKQKYDIAKAYWNSIGSNESNLLLDYNNKLKGYNSAKTNYDNAVEKQNLETYKENTQNLQDKVDWASVITNSASALSSVGSLVAGGRAISSLKKADGDLKKCQEDISNLRTLFNQYDVESVNYGE